MLAQRLTVLGGSPAAPSDVAAHLTAVAGLDAELAEQVSWGASPALSFHHSDAIATAFSLNLRLLRAVMTDTSGEVAVEELLAVTEQLPHGECMLCATLAADAVEASERRDSERDLDGLLVDALRHQAEAHPTPAVLSQAELAVSAALRQLPSDAQERVLAYALSELDGI